MKKIMLFHNFNTSVGAGLCLIQIVEALKKEYELIVVLPEMEGDLSDILKNKNVHVIQLKNVPTAYAHYNGGSHLFFSAKHIKNINKINKTKNIIKCIIKENKPDIVFTNSLTLFWIGKIAKKEDIKTICYIRETYKNTLFNIRTNYIKNNLIKYFDKCIFISEYDLNATSDNYNRKQFKLITDKVDFSLYDKIELNTIRKQLNLPENKKIVLYVGGDNYIKGPLIALKAIKKCGHDICLVFLQHQKANKEKTLKQLIKKILKRDTSYEVEKYIQKNHIENKVFLRNKTSEVEKYFMACDLVIFPSVVAHQARPIYEAGYSKKTIIITDFKNTKEFANESNALLFEKNNYKELSKKINYVINNINKKDIKSKIIKNYNNTINQHSFETFNMELKECIEDVKI